MRNLLFIVLLFSTIVVSAQKTYYNQAFNISITFPDTWVQDRKYPSYEDAPLSDTSRKTLLKKEKSIYLTNFYYYPASISSGLIPKVQIDIVYKPEKTYEAFKAKTIESCKEFPSFLDDFKFIEQPTETTVGGVKCMRFTIQYSMIVSGKKMTVRKLTYAIPYKDYLFHLSMVDGEGVDKLEEFGAIIETIKIGK